MAQAGTIGAQLDMKKKYLILAALATGGLATAAVVSNRSPDPGPAGEAPELARGGDYPVGTEVRDYALPPRARISLMGAVTGSLPVEARSLKVRFWYPAEPKAGATPVRYDHDVTMPGKPVFPVFAQGIAFDRAAPVTGKKFPLILMSHGYSGWSEYLSNLGEALAAKGYVVASIDHQDMAFDSARTFMVSFGNVLIDRARDQREVLSAIIKQAGDDKSGVATDIDTVRPMTRRARRSPNYLQLRRKPCWKMIRRSRPGSRRWSQSRLGADSRTIACGKRARLQRSTYPC
jgi:Platelet-activating factor acetylhydrolase, isoform II